MTNNNNINNNACMEPKPGFGDNLILNLIKC